jgi:diaminopimelate decarboxylase
MLGTHARRPRGGLEAAAGSPNGPFDSTMPAYDDRTAPPLAAPIDWWVRPDLCRDGHGELCLSGQALGALATRLGTPVFVYSAARVSANVARLQGALGATGLRSRLLYALKANRHPPLLAHLRTLGIGLDVCSPGEVRHALGCGYALESMSFTAGCLSRADHAALAGWPALRVNADSLSAIERLAATSPGRTIGLRVNPATGVGYGDNPMVRYAGQRATKFGIYLDRFEEALALADRLGLVVDGLHCHAGSGFLAPQLPDYARVLDRMLRFLERAPGIRRINLGGGLGVPLRASDRALDLAEWATLVRERLGGRDLLLEIEPGDHIVKDAGVLLTEITQVEDKGGVTWVGIDAGFNVHPEPAFYDLPMEPVPARLRPGQARQVAVCGNLNEALDLWAAETSLAPVAEGDILCLLNAGAYGASMASRHCLREPAAEHLIPAAAPASADALDAANKQAWDALYASTGERVWGDEPMPFLATFAEDLQSRLADPSRVLDAGCGEGRNLPALLALGADETHALDASRHALDKIPELLRSRIIARCGDLAATGYPDAHFDVITLLDTAETLPNVDTALGEMRRILKPGGVLLCNIPGYDDGVAGTAMEAVASDAFLYQQRYFYRFVEPERAEAMMVKAGLVILRSEHHSWIEAPHPGFRPEVHRHTSHVLLALRPAGGGCP